MNWISFVVCLAVGWVVHELAHVLAFFLSTWHMAGLRMALGKLRRVRIRFMLREFGCAVGCPELGGSKYLPRSLFNSALFSLAGPASNIFVCVAAIWIFPAGKWLNAFEISYSLLGFCNMIPTLKPYFKILSDGQQVVGCLFMSNPERTYHLVGRKDSPRTCEDFFAIDEDDEVTSMNLTFKPMTDKEFTLISWMCASVSASLLFLCVIFFIK